MKTSIEVDEINLKAYVAQMKTTDDLMSPELIKTVVLRDEKSKIYLNVRFKALDGNDLHLFNFIVEY